MTQGRRPRLSLRGLGLLVAANLVAPGIAVATGADCEAVKTSTMPYELQLRQADGRAFPVQVYRGKRLTRLQYTKVQGHLVISRFQANFQLEYVDLAGLDMRFAYSVPTDRYVWQQDVRALTYTTIISGEPTTGPGVTQAYEMLPDATMPVGDCMFAVKHFRFKQVSSERSSDEEVWFSPELSTNLRLVEVATLSKGKTMRRELQASAITTDVAPLQ